MRAWIVSGFAGIVGAAALFACTAFDGAEAKPSPESGGDAGRDAGAPAADAATLLDGSANEVCGPDDLCVNFDDLAQGGFDVYPDPSPTSSIKVDDAGTEHGQALHIVKTAANTAGQGAIAFHPPRGIASAHCTFSLRLHHVPSASGGVLVFFNAIDQSTVKSDDVRLTMGRNAHVGRTAFVGEELTNPDGGVPLGLSSTPAPGLDQILDRWVRVDVDLQGRRRVQVDGKTVGAFDPLFADAGTNVNARLDFGVDYEDDLKSQWELWYDDIHCSF